MGKGRVDGFTGWRGRLPGRHCAELHLSGGRQALRRCVLVRPRDIHPGPLLVQEKSGPVRVRPISGKFLAPLGLGAGFLDAAGGGGWGPVSTPTLLSSGRMEPRKVVGTVDASEFVVAICASVGFLV